VEEYRVVEENSVGVLQNVVNALLAEGWEVTGGFTSFNEAPKALPNGQIVEPRVYCQAMIKAPDRDATVKTEEVQEVPEGPGSEGTQFKTDKQYREQEA